MMKPFGVREVVALICAHLGEKYDDVVDMSTGEVLA